jgi:hypothetical protein
MVRRCELRGVKTPNRFVVRRPRREARTGLICANEVRSKLIGNSRFRHMALWLRSKSLPTEPPNRIRTRRRGRRREFPETVIQRETRGGCAAVDASDSLRQSNLRSLIFSSTVSRAGSVTRIFVFSVQQHRRARPSRTEENTNHRTNK